MRRIVLESGNVQGVSFFSLVVVPGKSPTSEDEILEGQAHAGVERPHPVPPGCWDEQEVARVQDRLYNRHVPHHRVPVEIDRPVQRHIAIARTWAVLDERQVKGGDQLNEFASSHLAQQNTARS